MSIFVVLPADPQLPGRGGVAVARNRNIAQCCDQQRWIVRFHNVDQIGSNSLLAIEMGYCVELGQAGHFDLIFVQGAGGVAVGLSGGIRIWR